jgi:hypothetical protein
MALPLSPTGIVNTLNCIDLLFLELVQDSLTEPKTAENPEQALF